MSASTEKKNRQAARQAGTDKKQLAAQEAAQKAAVSKRRWTIGTIVVAVLIVLIILLNSPLMYRITTAETIGAKNYSPADVRCARQSSNYTAYASYFGEDYARQLVESNMIQTAALLQYAQEEGITLTDAEKAAVDKSFESLAEAAASNKVSVSRYLSAVYGKGVNQSVLRKSAEERVLSGKAYNSKLLSLNASYSAEQLDAYYADLNGESDLFSFAVYTVPVTEELPDAEAYSAAEAIMIGYQEGEDGEPVDRLNDVIAEEFPEGSAEQKVKLAGSALDAAYKAWLMEDRQAGDITVVKNSTEDGYYVVLFQERSDNSDTVAQVRHILIKAEAQEDGSYTEEAKAAAKAKAEEILATWEAGDKSELSFATLAGLYSEDSGSSGNGGLYDSIVPGQTVEEFDRFCFEPHNYGDTAIVYGESGSYAGYHIMFYVGTDMSSRVIAKNALTSEAMNDWLSGLTESLEPVYRWAYKLV